VAQGRASRRAQRGLALVALLTVAVLAFAYVLTTRLNAASMFVGIDRDHNAQAMARAKQALVGWMVLNAAGTDADPGRLPCPEAPGSFGNPALEGIAASSCLPPSNVGRLPWRTLGLERLVDAAGEPLWYAVSPAWSKQGSANNVINADSLGQLTVNGAANDAVALIVAPGAVLTVATGGGCTSWSQVRPAAGIPDVRNYLECGNEAGSFVTGAAGQTFNDQLLRVSATDLIPALAAAIQQRMQREIAPALRSVYGSSTWGTSSGNPLFPFAARFDNPHPGSATYRGEDGRYHGLLPVTSSNPGCGGDPRCSTTFVDFSTGSTPTMSISGFGSLLVSSSCTISSTQARCTGVYASVGNATLRMSNVRARNVAMALRTLTPPTMTAEYGLVPYTGGTAPGTSATGSFNTDGSVDLVLRAQVPGLVDGLGLPLNVFFRFTADLGVLADHPLLDPTDATTGWFVRNEWFRTTYYATRLRSTADGISSLGCADTNDPNWGCLRFNDSGTYNIRALLVLAGASLGNPAGRPNNVLADYVEYQNCDLSGGVCDPQTLYEQRVARSSRVGLPAINAPFNDRVVLVDWRSSLLANQASATTPELRLVTLP
jgi:hypothetical protein